MNRRVELGCRTVPELGSHISELVERVVPHDGYVLFGMDPITRVGCFGVRRNSYSAKALRRIITETASDDLARGDTGPVRLFALGTADPRADTHLRIMGAEGFGSELRVELADGGRTWGMLILLRERGRTSFSRTDTARAAAMSRPLAITMRRFVAGSPLRSASGDQSPGLVLLGEHNELKAITPTGRAAVRSLAHDDASGGEDILDSVWDIAQRARQAGTPVVCRGLTSQGWVAMHAQLLGGDVAVTIQPASAAVLLPAVAAWYGITPREQAVLEHALEGLPAKQIARRLEVSPHTVHDHFKAIYRKAGVTSRDELLACLTR